MRRRSGRPRGQRPDGRAPGRPDGGAPGRSDGNGQGHAEKRSRDRAGIGNHRVGAGRPHNNLPRCDPEEGGPPRRGRTPRRGRATVFFRAAASRTGNSGNCGNRSAAVEASSKNARETNRVQKVPQGAQGANVKLSSVASDALGVSGRAILGAVIQGEEDPEVLASFAQGRLKFRIPDRVFFFERMKTRICMKTRVLVNMRMIFYHHRYYYNSLYSITRGLYG